MEIENEQLGIPDTPYKCTIKMPSSEFERIVRDLQVLGDTCTIACTKEGVRFSVSGSIGTGNILTRANASPEKDKDQVIIDMDEPVELNFALRYLNFFTKASSLSEHVIIQMSQRFLLSSSTLLAMPDPCDSTWHQRLKKSKLQNASSSLVSE